MENKLDGAEISFFRHSCMLCYVMDGGVGRGCGGDPLSEASLFFAPCLFLSFSPSAGLSAVETPMNRRRRFGYCLSQLIYVWEERVGMDRA